MNTAEKPMKVDVILPSHLEEREPFDHYPEATFSSIWMLIFSFVGGSFVWALIIWILFIR